MRESLTQFTNLFESPVSKQPFLTTNSHEESSRYRAYEFESASLITDESALKIRRHLEGSRELPYIYEELLTQAAADVPALVENFEELGIYDHLFDEDLSGKKNGVAVSWNSQMIPKNCGGGTYLPVLRKVLISYPQPSYVDRILSLATRGMHHKSLRTYAHEFAHDMQFRMKPKDGPFDWNKQSELPTELIEAQAYLVSDPHLSIRRLYEHILDAKYENGRRIYPRVNPQKLLQSLESFAILNACGVTQSEIAKLVNNPGRWISRVVKINGYWSEPQYNYTNIYDKVEKEMKKSNLTPSELLTQADEIRQDDEDLVRSIVCEGLTKIVGEHVVMTA